MTFFETLRVALLDLALHKFRSALTTLGIIFGVASVEAMVSISQGAQSEAVEHIAGGVIPLPAAMETRRREGP
jgi:putative ABC transport system permease protein